MQNLWQLIVLSVVFVASLLTFYFTKRIIKNNDNLMLAVKVIAFVLAFACVIIAVVITE